MVAHRLVIPGFYFVFALVAWASLAWAARSQPPPHGLVARTVAGGLAAISVFTGCLIAANRSLTDANVIGYTLAVMLIGGGLSLCIGAVWDRHELRLLGWITIVVALSVPSTLTLFLPIVGAFAFVIRRVEKDYQI
jgi:Ca2+/H+ antiporter